MGAERFSGLTSNGSLPGGEMGRLQRRLLINAGKTPIIQGEEHSPKPKQKRQRKRWVQVSKGVTKWLPDELPN